MTSQSCGRPDLLQTRDDRETANQHEAQSGYVQGCRTPPAPRPATSPRLCHPTAGVGGGAGASSLSRRGPDAHRAATRPEQIREKCGGTCAPLGWPLTSAGPGALVLHSPALVTPGGASHSAPPRGQLPPGGRDRPPGPDGLPSARVALTFSCAGVPGVLLCSVPSFLTGSG